MSKSRLPDELEAILLRFHEILTQKQKKQLLWIADNRTSCYTKRKSRTTNDHMKPKTSYHVDKPV